MDYEKKYKEALEWARNVKQGKVGFVLDDVLEKFPELKESDSDMMRNGIIEELIHLIDGIIVISNQTIERKHKLYKYIDWLKSIEDKVQPQQKEEWSEEDRNRLNHVIKLIKYNIEDGNYCYGYDGRDYLSKNETIDFLNSLKDKYTWKPSNEQIEALDNARHSNPFNVHVLDTLFHDLKKLREE